MKHPEKPWVVIAPYDNELYDFTTHQQAMSFVVDERLRDSKKAHPYDRSLYILKLNRSWKGDDRP